MSYCEIYQDTAKKWRWRFVATNGRILADSGQGYARKVDCLHGLKIVTGRHMKTVVKP